ncbi:acyl-CoA thioesterase [Tengunoibacter tsumagoiensis]|uniref:Thioesterase n=1 Tax=Tengunoibacter tsumagoiensis TaxID=2014871 RepID=A0A402A6P8_9CHLR|nr:thioesterase family protein [Tengunoibacter tsumagoiensis]GCE14798.1 hypothetical protein KTT_46570 [Tengunoibacter tsumagoiensis]
MAVDSYQCWYPVEIRIRDLDPLAHVNNTVHFIYFEEARGFYFDQLKPWLSPWPPDDEDPIPPNPRIQTGPYGPRYGMLVKEVTCTYLFPLTRGDRAEVGIKVSQIGNTSFLMDHIIRDRHQPERLFATGRSVMVWCNYLTGRPHPVPLVLRSAIEQLEQQSFPPKNS